MHSLDCKVNLRVYETLTSKVIWKKKIVTCKVLLFMYAEFLEREWKEICRREGLSQSIRSKSHTENFRLPKDML